MNLSFTYFYLTSLQSCSNPGNVQETNTSTSAQDSFSNQLLLLVISDLDMFCAIIQLTEFLHFLLAVQFHVLSSAVVVHIVFNYYPLHNYSILSTL